MTTKKPTRSPHTRSSQKSGRSPITRRVASNVVQIHEHLIETRGLRDAQRLRHVFIYDIAQKFGSDVSGPDFDIILRAELRFMLA